MNLLCKLFGHNMVRELQIEDNTPVVRDGWSYHKIVTTFYLCSRCCYSFKNSSNFGNPLKETDK